jgi:hypothetical protein
VGWFAIPQFLAAMPDDAVDLREATPPTCGDMPGLIR